MYAICTIAVHVSLLGDEDPMPCSFCHRRTRENHEYQLRTTRIREKAVRDFTVQVSDTLADEGVDICINPVPVIRWDGLHLKRNDFTGLLK